jgi:xanthine/uracil permease
VTAARVAWACAAAVFALSVAVQHNDPDPAPWMAMYGAAAMLCAARAAGRAWRMPPLVVGAVALVWCASLLPDAVGWLRSPRSGEPVALTMKTDDPGEELAREAGGLTLVVLACVALARRPRRGDGAPAMR